ncbi:MAG: right-handed parallel beta-helix repeat-containing protein [Alphaproteobacteria bacterium]
MDRRRFMKDATALVGAGMAPRLAWADAARAAGTPADLGFQSGLRRLHVSAGLAPPLDGSTPDALFATLQEAMDAAEPGDVVTVAAGIYRERPELRDVAATEALPLWIVAERRGSVLISDSWAEAENGDVVWTDAGDGVYHAACEERPYIGEHDGDFLMAYLSEDDLRAPSIVTYSAIHGEDIEVSKPPYGFAFEPAERRLYLKLRDGRDPNGQAVRLTGSFGRSSLSVSRSSHVILDGFVFEGAGDSQAVAFDDGCDHATVRNAVFWLARHGVRCPSNTILESCAYRYVGFDRWTRELFALDGAADNGVFALVKGYYHADAVGVGGGAGNALLEGSLDFGYNFQDAQSNILIDRCLIGPCFDGSRIGEFVDSEIKDTVFLECRDDGFQNEGPDGKPSSNNRIHDCRFIDCYHDTSHQGRSIDGDAFVYRNVFEWTDPALAIPHNFSIKMIASPAAADVYYYQNTWVIDYGASYGGALGVWADFGGDSSAGEIEAFINNVVVIPHDLSDGRGLNPKIIASNAVVAASPADAGFLTANGGVYAGSDSADMGLNADRSLQEGSPARGIGQPLPTPLPDSRTDPDAYRDAGAFPFGERPGADWPRPRRIVFDDRPPARWTSPGLSR